MSHWQTFQALCADLRAGLLDGGGGGAAHALAAWRGLIETAKVHSVTPALSWCAREEPSVPAELRSYLDAVLRLNGKRNERLRETLAHAVAALNAIDIEPVLLKGAAHLVGELYPTPALRLMGDLDLLIPQERDDDAVAAMARIGFYVDQALPEAHRHLPLMRHVETNVVVELHNRLSDRRSDPIVAVSWVREQSMPIAFRDLRVRLPGPAALIAHNVVHDQLIDRNYNWTQFELRQLLDLALIRARHEPAIDWAELDRRFSLAGFGRVLATYLCYDELLFGQPMPAIASAPRARAVERLRQAMDESPVKRQARKARRALWTVRYNLLAGLPKAYLQARRRHPLGLIRLFDPRTWMNRLRVIGRALKEISH